VLQRGGEPDLAQEALGAEQGAQLGAEDLESDLPVVLGVPSEVDRGHAAASELALERVAVTKGVGQGGGRPVGHEDALRETYRIWRSRPAAASTGGRPHSRRRLISLGLIDPLGSPA